MTCLNLEATPKKQSKIIIYFRFKEYAFKILGPDESN